MEIQREMLFACTVHLELEKHLLQNLSPNHLVNNLFEFLLEDYVIKLSLEVIGEPTLVLCQEA